VEVNVVPTPRTRAIAQRMIADAVQDTGPDAALRHLSRVQQEQLPALVGVLLTNAKMQRQLGRPRLPLTYTDEQRRRANRQYKAGMRDEWTVTGWREYQRYIQHRRTQRVGRFGR
jgi:hypothetical protein